MKNSIHIDATNNCLCDLVSSVNDGTNRIILTIICDVSLNPRLIIGSTTVTLTDSNCEYEITADSLPVGATYTFTISDDEHTGNQFTIRVPNELSDNWSLKQISNFEYQISKKDGQSDITQALLDKVYPIGCVFINSENVNPSAQFGGTWVLIDKSFEDFDDVSSTEYFEATNGNVTSYSVAVTRSGHNLRLRLNFTNTVELNDSQVWLGVFKLDVLGVSSLSNAYDYPTAGSDGGNAVPLIVVESDGRVRSVDIIGKTSGTMASGSSVFVDVPAQIPKEYMLDEFCDKFYWKRTA